MVNCQLVDMRQWIGLILGLLFVLNSPPLFAHEEPTHVEMTQQALGWLSYVDSRRYNLLRNRFGFVVLTALLSDGSWNEDSYFYNCTISVECYLGRFFFHFLPPLDDYLSHGEISVGPLGDDALKGRIYLKGNCDSI